MTKKIIFLAFILLFISSSSFAQSPQISSGLAYLTATQNPDGSWGGGASYADYLPSTVSVIDALKALNQTGTAGYSDALSWLNSQGLNTADYLSERIYSLSASGADLSLLLLYEDPSIGAWGDYYDFKVNNLNTALALQAFKTINYPDLNIISHALGYLTGAQNPDGGWGFTHSTSSGGDYSNVYMTAMVLNTLSQFKTTYNLQTNINNAVSYLLSHQNPDGGFGSSPATVYETALAFEALLTSGADISSSAPNAINYLLSTQSPNGSWNDDPYSTALALRDYKQN